jgi:hypothetical protein
MTKKNHPKYIKKSAAATAAVHLTRSIEVLKEITFSCPPIASK